MSDYTFLYDERLGIDVPHLSNEWHVYSVAERIAIVSKWEHIRGSIPDKIKALEGEINTKQARLNDEDNFAASCELNAQIAELASRINDLHLWFRVNQHVEASGKTHM